MGGYRTVARLTGYLRRREHLGAVLPSVPVGLTPGQAAGLAVARPDNRGPREEEALAQLESLHPQLKAALELFSSFAALFRSPPSTVGAAEHLREWIRQADGCGIPELRAFAAKLRQDQDAVVGALALPYSQGQTEGFITTLKLLKRSMYDIVGECLASSQQCSEAGWTSRGTGHVDQPRHGSQQIERCGRQEMLKMRPSETDVA